MTLSTTLEFAQPAHLKQIPTKPGGGVADGRRLALTPAAA
jgi:hypothetical protein